MPDVGVARGLPALWQGSKAAGLVGDGVFACENARELREERVPIGRKGEWHARICRLVGEEMKNRWAGRRRRCGSRL